jgi:hypothetical protein
LGVFQLRFQDAIAAVIDPGALVDVITMRTHSEPPREPSWTEAC